MVYCTQCCFILILLKNKNNNLNKNCRQPGVFSYFWTSLGGFSVYACASPPALSKKKATLAFLD